MRSDGMYYPYFKQHLENQKAAREGFDQSIPSRFTAVYIPLIVLANFVVLFTIIKIEKLHTPQNVILACLAIVDLLYGLVIIPINIVSTFNIHDIWKNTYMCWFRMSSFRFFLYISLSFLMLMTVEHFVAINFVFHYSKVTNRRAIGAAMILVVIEICQGPIFVARLLDKKLCSYANNLELLEIIYIDGVKMAIVLSISVFFSLKVVFVAWRQRKKVQANLTPLTFLERKNN